jgi:hypothetical protein
MHVHPERLQLPTDQVGTVTSRRFEDAQRDRIDADRAERADIVREPRDLLRLRLDRAEKARHLEVDAGDLL